MNRLLTIVDSKYQRLEYLESSGTQYIDTDYIAKTNTVFEVDCAFTDLSAGRNGSLWALGTNTCRYYFGVLSSKFIGANSTLYNHNIQDADTQRHKFAIKQDGIYIDDINVYSSNAVYGNTAKIYLFAINDTGVAGGVNYYCKQKTYGSKIWDNGTLVRNFVPVLRKTDNELGMLDLVEGKFYTNAGTGKFTANLDTMYAIIQGSPTQSPYGVFSGFSSSNYLSITNNETIDKIEFVMKITTAELTGTQVLFRSTNTNFIIRISGVYLQFDFLAGSSTVLSTSDISANSTIWVKVICENGNQNLLVSTDGINYVSKATNTKTGIDFTGFLTGVIGCRPTVDNYKFLGSIDLNRSYIKIGSTKYKLQAVVGYTVVGSPTITDGVVSGFSSANYLTLPSTFDVNKNFEIVTKFSVISIAGFQNIFGIANSSATSGGLKFDIGSSRVQAQIGNLKNLQINRRLSANNTYILKWQRIDNIGYLKLFNENEILIDEISVADYGTAPKTLEFTMGVSATSSKSGYLAGSVDLNNTYIKTDGKLWFNGQPS